MGRHIWGYWDCPYCGAKTIHYNQVLDHYEKEAYDVYDHDDISYDYRDLGNGQFEEVKVRTPVYRTEYRDVPVYRDEPVYAPRYYYEIEKWQYDHSLKSSGNDKSPYWSEVPVLLNDGNVGSKREGNRYEYYYIYDAKSRQHEISYSVWNQLEQGQKIEYKAFRFSSKIPENITILE